ncbi:hypothetical protein [Novosphingobium sp. 9]|uniref:hypothetical protein n=1 Tax=Novosphingobium sp. 9 TaxID=2025349 RepID=UPI0021B64C19|nr:hypothetical protein [Novosphingobium sp. 9]
MALPPRRQPSRWKRNTAILLVLALVFAFLLARGSLRDDAIAATAFGARTGCVCRYVSGRELSDCKGDLKAANLGPVAAFVWLSADDGASSVMARVPFLASQRATFAPDRGCQLEAWEE